MNVRVLGCSGSISQGCQTTAFLIDDDMLIDAGTGVGTLTLEAMHKIDRVFLTHAHLDHIAALPLMIDAVAAKRQAPIQIYALAETIAALQKYIFNNVIWPDFSRIPSVVQPFLTFHTLTVGQKICIGDKHIEVLPAVHSVPAVGYAVSRHGGPNWVFTGDTERNPAFWERLNQLNVGMLIIETAFSNGQAALAQRSLHLSPQVLAQELEGIAPGKQFPIYITHTKPAETDMIMSEIAQFDQTSTFTRHLAHDIRWLSAGQELVI